jgi:voltage-gated sodium channel
VEQIDLVEMKELQAILCNERIMLYAIVLNTAIMFLGGFWPNSMWFDLSDALFTLLFLSEAISKISKYGWSGYWKNGWNKFDFIVLVVALPTLASLFIEQTTATSTILALRSMRLFKSFKMLRFIPNIHKLLKGIKLAVRASLLVFIAFVVFLVIFSILSSTIFGTITPEYFGNPAISLYSIFRLFSIEGWYELPDAIANNGTPFWGVFARCYFSVLMFLGGIIGMSLVNSIFVDAMAEDNNDEVLEKLKQIEEKINNLAQSKK